MILEPINQLNHRNLLRGHHIFYLPVFSLKRIRVTVDLVQFRQNRNQKLCSIAASRISQAYESLLAGLESRLIFVVERCVVFLPIGPHSGVAQESIKTVGSKGNQVRAIDQKPLM